MTPANFAAKWERVTTTERASSQSHFLDLCELLEVEKPPDADPTGTFYTFERAVTKTTGGKGFADVRKLLPSLPSCWRSKSASASRDTTPTETTSGRGERTRMMIWRWLPGTGSITARS